MHFKSLITKNNSNWRSKAGGQRQELEEVIASQESIPRSSSRRMSQGSIQAFYSIIEVRLSAECI